MPTTYEWDIETWSDDDEDIIDHHHRDRLHDFGGEELTQAVNEDNHLRLVLVRDVMDEGGVRDRSWAYVKDGKLEEWFTYCGDDNKRGTKVPARFHREFNL